MKTTTNAPADTAEIKTQKRKHRKKTFLRVLAGFLAVLIAFIGVTTVISVIGIRSNINKSESFPAVSHTAPEFEKISDGVWNIHSDSGIKVLQLTDIHLGGGWMSMKKDSMCLNAVAAMISAEKPDLVIVTGDIAYPVPFQAGTFNNKSGAKMFASLMETLGVYWTLSFGNHDTEAYSYYSREKITEFYTDGSYPHCLLGAGPETVDGCGNQILKVVNSDGLTTRAFIIMDSHSYIDGDILGIQWKYDNIHDNQIEWYTSSINVINSDNAEIMANMTTEDSEKYEDFPDCVPTSVFQHIPLTEYKTAWNEYVDNGYQDTADVKYNYGIAGETGNIVYCGIHEDNYFETMITVGSTDTVFCGHDHLNNFSLNYKGIYLTYSMSLDYLAYPGIYKLGAQRGCTVIDIDKYGAISFKSQNYYQDKYTSYYDKESVTMQVTTLPAENN